MSQRIATLIILAAALIAWYPGLRDAAFIWDDDQYVTENDNLESISGLIDAWIAPRSLPQYYPLTHTSFYLERALVGENPHVFRGVNLLLHALSALLLLGVLRRLALPGAFFAALLFAVHPLQAESVLWITERKNTLSLFLALLSLRGLLKFAENRSRRDLALAFLLFIAALAAKTVVCALPAVYLVIRWSQRRLEMADIKAMTPFFVLGALAAWFTGHLEATLVGASGATWNLSALERVAIAGRALLFYAGKLLWPLQLSFNYQRWDMSDGLLDLGWAFAALLPLIVAVIAWKRGLCGRGPLAALLLFGGLLVPALGFVNVYPMRYSFVADHFQYHAGPALLALIAAAMTRLSAGIPRPAVMVAAAVILAALTALSWRRAEAYSSPEALWRDTIAVNPESFLAHHNLGDLLRRHGDLEAALEQHERALALRPDLGELHTEVAVDLEALGRRAEALLRFQAAVDAAPDDARLRLNLARALINRGRAEEALTEIARAELLVPDSPIMRGLRGSALLARGRLAEALPDLEAAAKSPTATLGDQLNLSLLIERMRGPTAALAALPDPTPFDLSGRRAWLLVANGEPRAAFDLLTDLIGADRRDVEVIGTWVYLLATRREPVEEAELDRAASLLGGFGEDDGRIPLLRARAALAARRGDFEAARRLASVGLSVARQHGTSADQALFSGLIDIYGRGSIFLTW